MVDSSTPRRSKRGKCLKLEEVIDNIFSSDEEEIDHETEELSITSTVRSKTSSSKMLSLETSSKSNKKGKKRRKILNKKERNDSP